MKHTQRFSLFAPALLAIVVGCGPSAGNSASGDAAGEWPSFAGKHPLKAICTTGMVAEVVRNVGGAHVEVEQIMGEDIDPHLFTATPDVISKLSRADAIFYSGLHLEGRMAEVFERLALRKPTIAVTSSVPRERLISVGHEELDPHVWFDVALWALTIDSVEKFLAKFDPPHAADYQKAAASYRDELKKLDEECRSRLATIPTDRRAMVTAHDAFHYFGRAYNVEVRAVQGVSTETEAGVKEINTLVDFLVARKIRAVFLERSVGDRNMRALLEGCQAQGHSVTIGGELFSDSMGKVGTPEGTYVGMVRHNIDVIVKALQ
ncbi:MAG: zinc ABC transporter substrate-binding protein [Pirellulales bacterium]